MEKLKYIFCILLAILLVLVPSVISFCFLILVIELNTSFNSFVASMLVITFFNIFIKQCENFYKNIIKG